MYKIFTLIFAMLFAVSYAFAATVTVGGDIEAKHLYTSNADQNKDTKGEYDLTTPTTAANTGQAAKSEFRNYVNFWINSQINDKLSGKVYLMSYDNTAATEYEEWGNNNVFLPKFYEAYFNYMPIENLNVKIGRQAWKLGKGYFVSDYASNAVHYSQNGLMLTYEMPEIFKVYGLYALLDNDTTAGAYVDKKAVANDKFYGIWLQTKMVPFLQDINLAYLVNYNSDAAALDKDEIDDTLSTVALEMHGTVPIGPVTALYGAFYGMNMGENTQRWAAVPAIGRPLKDEDWKYSGSTYTAYAGGALPDLAGLTLALQYTVFSGDEDMTDDKVEAWRNVHPGAEIYNTHGKIFGTGYANAFDALCAGNGFPGLKMIKTTLSAYAMKTLKATFYYSIYSFDNKEGTANLAMPGDKDGMKTQYVLYIDYTGIENLALQLGIGNQKKDKDNYATAKDGTWLTKVSAKYTF
jgi:hypothetical protein